MFTKFELYVIFNIQFTYKPSGVWGNIHHGLSRGRQEARQRTHYPLFVGSNPTPATNLGMRWAFDTT